MANVFDDLDPKAPANKDSAGVATNRPAGAKNPFDDLDPSAAPKVAPPTAPASSWGRGDDASWWDKTGRFGLDTLTKFNDAATFGMFPKVVDAISGGHHNQDAIQDIDENNPAASIAGSTLGYLVPGAGIESGLSKALPKLAANTFKAAAMRGAATNATLRVADDTARGNNPDPMGLTIDTLGGAVLGPLSHGGVYYGSPKARVRALGTKLTDADKTNAMDFAHEAVNSGIPLNANESLQATAPGRSQDVRARYDSATQSPAGSVSAATFDANRTPAVKLAGRGVVSGLGGGIDPVDAMEFAKGALKSQKASVASSANPAFQAIATKKMPPTWVPRSPAVAKAISDVAQDDVVMKGLERQIGAPAATNSVAFLDAVKEKLYAQANQLFEKDPNKARFVKDEAQNLEAQLDRATQGRYANWKATLSSGNATTKGLEKGPLGTLAKSAKTGTQGDALFGVTTDADKTKALEALARVDAAGTGTGQGILANRIDNAVSTDPLHFGNNALPNEYAEDVAKAAVGSNYDQVGPTLAASRAISGAKPPIASQHEYGPWNAAWRALQNYGQGDVVDLLNNPKNIKMMNTRDPVERGITLTTTGAIQTATDRRRRRSQLEGL